MEKTRIEISSWTIVKVFLIAIAFYLFFLVRDVVAMFFIVLILTATFSPTIKSWQKYLGRYLSIVALFLIFLLVVAGIIYAIIPPLVTQITQLANNVPDYINAINLQSIKSYVPDIRNSLDSISSNLGSLTSNIFSFTSSVFYGIFAVLMVLVLTFYMLAEENNIKIFASSLFLPKHREEGIDVINKIAAKVGSWFRGQMLLCGIIFIVHLIGLSIIGVPYALVLAILAGFLEIIPTVGPTISGAIGFLVALTISPWMALIVVIWYILVQALENVFLVPKIMQKAVGISPVIILLALFVGAKLMGMVGAILSVPVAASVSVLIIEWPTIVKIFSKET